MKKSILKDSLITLGVMLLTFGVSIVLQRIFEIQGEHITAVFVFSVFIVSLLTDGYVYGILSSIVGVLLVNWAFTYPYFGFDFTVPANMFSSIVMITISVTTSSLTTQLKRWQSVKAESELERMRANLLRAVSHDLRTPLTTIYGASSAILDNGEMLSEGQKTKMLLGIKEDSEWLIHMVENLLSVTKFDSGSVELIKTPTVLEELIDSVIVSFKKHYPERPVALDLPEELVVIPMDALLIKQVITNMLENVIHHAVGYTEMSLKVTVSDGTAIFEVSDDGCGIPKERLDTIFSGYSPASEDEADSKIRNAGIGLSVCATIIRAHGGEISCENLKEGGAAFRFALACEESTSDE